MPDRGEFPLIGAVLKAHEPKASVNSRGLHFSVSCSQRRRTGEADSPVGSGDLSATSHQMRRLLIALAALVLAACSTANSTLKSEGSTTQVLYDIPEQQAFQIAFSSLGRLLPGYEITDIDGPTKGYTATFRFVLDTFTQQVMVIPAVGKGSDGRQVRGYYFEVSGRGSSGQGLAKNHQLFEMVAEAAKATGKGVAVTSVGNASYTGAQWKQGQLAQKSGTGTEAMDQLERLKALRDSGAVTADEYEKKKKELLDRI